VSKTLPAAGVSDAARRASDVINLHLATIPWDTARMGWVAIRMSDGGSDGNLYFSKAAAIKHQLHEQQCCYVALRSLIAGTTPRDMEIFLRWNREAYNAGLRIGDPDAPDMIMPSRIADQYKKGLR
jgi:hypothetical protein